VTCKYEGVTSVTTLQNLMQGDLSIQHTRGRYAAGEGTTEQEQIHGCTTSPSSQTSHPLVTHHTLHETVVCLYWGLMRLHKQAVKD
jgi:hypothetical protein